MPTFSHLYSSALDYELGTDDSTRLFTTARRKQAINEGVEQFGDLTGCFQRQREFPTSHGVREYSLQSTVNIPSADFVRLSAQLPEFRHVSSGSTAQVTYLSGENFQRRDVDWLNRYEPGWRASTGGTPQYWYERTGSGQRFFALHPPPEIGSSETAFVLLGYIAKAPILTSDTDVPWSNPSAPGSTGIRSDLEVYHQGIVHYAAHKLEKLRVNTEAMQTQFQLFLGWVDRYRIDQRPKGGQTVRTSRDYFAESRHRGTQSDLPTNMRGWSY